MPQSRVLLVDDDESVRSSLQMVLASNQFEVAVAANVPEALKLITTQTFDVLLSDLNMPGPGDGLTVVSAMRHANPKAATLLLTAHPRLGPAIDAIVMQADQILVKPISVPALIRTINDAVANLPPPERVIEPIASILEREADATIERWFELVEEDDKLMTLKLSSQDRTGHLPRLLEDLIVRLRSSQPLGSKALRSVAAHDHGITRRNQGYLASMLVQESRMLQVSLFDTLQRNLEFINYSVLMLDVMTIADECDSQLAQAMESYCLPAAATQASPPPRPPPEARTPNTLPS